MLREFGAGHRSELPCACPVKELFLLDSESPCFPKGLGGRVVIGVPGADVRARRLDLRLGAGGGAATLPVGRGELAPASPEPYVPISGAGSESPKASKTREKGAAAPR